jgi:hypothetical protein
MADDRARKTRRLVIRILVLLFVGFGAVVTAVILAVGSNYYRLERFREQTRRAIVATPSEADVRQRFRQEVHARLLARDFVGLDAQAAELRRTDERFAGTSESKLTHFYRGLGDGNPTTDADWTAELDRVKAWMHERPASVTGRIAVADRLIDYARDARGDGWAHEVPADRMAAFEQRLQEAQRVTEGAGALAERCPRLFTLLLYLARGLGWSQDEEQELYEVATREYPDEQSYHSLHLNYLQQHWHGAPGQWEDAARRILLLPAGPEKYAHAVWYASLDNQAGRDVVSWPDLKRGFDQILVRHPDWFEARSVYLRFACIFDDQPTAQSILRDLRHRRDASVWVDPEDLVDAYAWAEFEDTERAGGDPLAAFFQRFMR